MSQSRNEARSTFSDTDRIILLEQDMDQVVQTTGSFQKILVGILISTVTASIMLALSLAVQLA